MTERFTATATAVAAEYIRARMEDSTMVITPEMAFRDCIATWRASQAPELPPGARPVEWLDPAELVERYPAMDAREATRESPLLAAMTRATPARALRLRLYTDRLEGPGWLGLLCQCAWLRGGIVGAT